MRAQQATYTSFLTRLSTFAKLLVCCMRALVVRVFESPDRLKQDLALRLGLKTFTVLGL